MTNNIIDQAVSRLSELSLEEIRKIHANIDRASDPRRKAFWRQIMDAKRFGGDDSNRLIQELVSRQPEDSIRRNMRGQVNFKEPSQPQQRTQDALQDVPNLTRELAPDKVKPDTIRREDVRVDAISRATASDQAGPMPSERTPSWALPDDQVSQEIRDFRQAFRDSNRRPEQPSTGAGGRGTATQTRDPRTPEVPITASDRTPGMDDILSRMSDELKQFVQTGNDGFLSRYVNSEQGQSDSLARQERLNYFLNDFKGILGPITDAVDMIQARRDERFAERLADRSMRTQAPVPMVRGENRILSNLIRESELARANPMQQLQPMIDQTNLGYQQDLARAREMSGGQAGVAAGLGQAASIRRDAQNQNIGRMAGDLYEQGIGRTAGLVGQQMGDDTWRDQQNIDIFRLREQRNMAEQQAAGMGLAMSRTRSLQARNNFLNGLLDSPVFDANTYMNFVRDNVAGTNTLNIPGVPQPTSRMDQNRFNQFNQNIQSQASAAARAGNNFALNNLRNQTNPWNTR